MTTTAEKVTPAEAAPVAEKPATENRMPLPDKRKALGRGLESLLPGGPRVVPGAAAVPAATATHPSPTGGHAAATPAPASAAIAEIQSAGRRVEGHTVLEIPLEQVQSNPYQTRSQITPESLEELAESIRANGVIQPITVRPAKDGKYVLITGERRTQASKLAGKQTIPAIVRHVSDQQAAEMTIIENLQRRDLNCLDQAEAFARLSRDFGLTQEEIGKRTGCEQESVAILETDTVAANVRAAEAALKGTDVALVEIRLAEYEMSGKAISVYNGTLHEIEAAMNIAGDALRGRTAFTRHRIIARPHENLTGQLNTTTRFGDAKPAELDGEEAT